MKRTIVFLLSAGFSLLTIAAENLIPYKILNRSEMAHYKVSYDIEVPIVGNRLPNEKELGAISTYLVSKEKVHDNSFVLFYLPGMKLGAGAYATAHHQPEMKVVIMKFMLSQYPEYRQYAQ